MLGIDARVEDLQKDLVKRINESDMPACILDFVLTQILNDVRMQRAGQVKKQREAYAKEQPQEGVSDNGNGTA